MLPGRENFTFSNEQVEIVNDVINKKNKAQQIRFLAYLLVQFKFDLLVKQIFLLSSHLLFTLCLGQKRVLCKAHIFFVQRLHTI